MKDRKKVEKIIEILDILYPTPHCSLTYDTPFQLLVATRLSAQCTDARVNIVTPRLFSRFPDAESFRNADIEEIEALIRSTGFFREKAASIKAFSAILADSYGGMLPKTQEELTALPGVGRKTANLVLWEVYGIPGLVIDTHAKRLAYRLGLTKNTDPYRVEKDLEPLIPKPVQTLFCHRLIHHGRAVCDARKPKCEVCALKEYCTYGK